MTKMECLIKRIRADDRMCDRINEIIDELDKSKDDGRYAYAIGAITAAMDFANRNKGERYGIKNSPRDFSDDDNRRLAGYLNKATA